jgi:branched-chain amino acid transport system substrate-binding protein
VAEAGEIPFLNPESSAHILTERGFEWFFRTGPTDVTFTQLFFDMFTFLHEQGQEISKIHMPESKTLPSGVVNIQSFSA